MAMGTQIRMYEKRGNKYPAHRVELPIVSLPMVSAFAKRYNIPQLQLTAGYMDFSREISKDDLTTWIRDGYIFDLDPVLETWLNGDIEFEVVDVLCYEWYND